MKEIDGTSLRQLFDILTKKRAKGWRLQWKQLNAVNELLQAFSHDAPNSIFDQVFENLIEILYNNETISKI